MPRAPKLITKELERSLPRIGAVEHERDPLIRAKLFTPDSNFNWYLLEYDPRTREAFAYVERVYQDGAEGELGYVSIDELEGIRGPYGLGVERDVYFRPVRLSEIRD